MRKPALVDDDLRVVAGYLSRPEAKAVLQAELPKRMDERFREEYSVATQGSDLSEKDYFLVDDDRKQGRELRVYFNPVEPVPVLVKELVTDQGHWRTDSCRINHTSLVMQLLECGFLLGDNSGNQGRIKLFMGRRFS